MSIKEKCRHKIPLIPQEPIIYKEPVIIPERKLIEELPRIVNQSIHQKFEASVDIYSEVGINDEKIDVKKDEKKESANSKKLIKFREYLKSLDIFLHM